MASLKWTRAALDDLHEIHEHIAEDRPAAAERIVRQIRAATERLSDFPKSGRLVRGREERGVREVIVRNYRVPYIQVGEEVRILRVVHGKRRGTGEDIEVA